MSSPAPEPTTNPHRREPRTTWGDPDAPRLVIALHGRTQSTDTMRELAARTTAPAHWVAPVADGASWYPYRFMETPPVDDRYLAWSLDAVDAAIEDAVGAGRPIEEIILLGFSQGACLAAEYALRTLRPFAGIALFTGGYLGARPREFTGDLAGMPVLLATSAEDEWVPLSRTEETRDAFDALRAQTTLLVEPGAEHAITDRAVRALDVLLTPGTRRFF